MSIKITPTNISVTTTPKDRIQVTTNDLGGGVKRFDPSVIWITANLAFDRANSSVLRAGDYVYGPLYKNLSFSSLLSLLFFMSKHTQKKSS